MRRITEVLRSHSRPRQFSHYPGILRAGEVLRFLTSVAEPCREGSSGPCQLDKQAHRELTLELQHELRAAHDILMTAGSSAAGAQDVQAVAQTVVLIMRIVQFTLGMPGLWVLQIRLSMTTLCSLIVDLLMVRLDAYVFALSHTQLLLDIRLREQPGCCSLLDTVGYPVFCIGWYVCQVS